MKATKQEMPKIRGSGWMSFRKWRQYAVLFLFAFAMGVAPQAAAKTYTFLGSGSWTNPGNWANPPGAPDPIDQINPDDTVVIKGVCDIPDGWTITVFGAVINEGTLKNAGTLEVEAGGSVSNSLTGTLINGGTLHTKPPFGLLPGGNLSNRGVISNTGTVDNEGDIVNAGGFGNGMTGSVNNMGTFFNAGQPTPGSFVNGGTFLNAGTTHNFGTVANTGMTLNAGALNNGSNAQMTNCTTGVVLNNGAMYNEEGSFAQQGLFLGTGTVNGATFTNEGTTTAGESPGVLTFDCSFVNAPDGVAFFELGGLGRNEETEFDQLVVLGTAYFGGTLEVVLINNFEPEIGNSFQIVSYGGYQGYFETELLPDLGPEAEWVVSYTTDGLVLTVVTASSAPDLSWGLEKVGEPFPNPVVGNQVSLPVNLEDAAEITIDLVLPDGRIVKQEKWQLGAGSQTLNLSLDRVPPTACLIRVSWNGKPVAYRKVVWSK